jgi:predicted  nucleic acid-binding Zn-ribbon protein
MALFKSKQSIENFNSPVLNKVMEFNDKKGRLAADLQANEDKIQVLITQLEEVRDKYADSLSVEDLNNFVALEGELNALKSVAKAQKDILAKGDKREYVLSEDEQKSLIQTFQPIRQKRDDLVQKLHSQLAEVENTLDELAIEQDKVHSAWAQIFGPVHSASQENWIAAVLLNKQSETVAVQNKLNQFVHHPGLRVHLWHV